MIQNTKKLKLAITICATSSYAYAMEAQARQVAANVAHLKGGHIILATDASEKLCGIHKYYDAVMPEGWQIHSVGDKALSEHPNYKQKAQLVIARLRTMAFTFARKLQVDYCWSLDSDVLPPSNSFRCMLQMLSFDSGYYSISTCSYPNEGFLGGRGSERHPIAEDYLPEERVLPWKLRNALGACARRISDLSVPVQIPQAPFGRLMTLDEKHDQNAKIALERGRVGKLLKEQARHGRLLKLSRSAPPRGNIFELNAKQWRQRGWLDQAYPAIGKGAVVPSDWCGFGCTLLNREALAHAHFEGYEGHGTEDLFIVWKKWAQMNLRINCITHVVCDHVINEKKKGGEHDKYTHIRAYHELAGECVGHIRTQKVPWLES